MVVISEDGEIEKKIIFTDIRGTYTFTIDTADDIIYFCLPRIASVKAVKLGEQ
jgi:hypothetical protein